MLSKKKLSKAFTKWNKDFFGYVYLRIKNREIAEEIVQEVFMKAWRSKDTFQKEKSSLKNWLFKITINTLNDHYKKNKQTLPLNEKIRDEKSKLSEKTENSLLVEKLSQAIKSLSSREQQLVILRYKNDLKIKDIAGILDLEESATKVAIHRARKKLGNLINQDKYI